MPTGPVSYTHLGDGLGLLGLGSSLNEGHATAGQQAFLDGGLGVTHGIFDAVLALLGLDLGGSADLDDSHAASQLGQKMCIRDRPTMV